MSKPKEERYTVCVDFDGVIHSYVSPWVDAGTIPDPPVEGAIEWLNEIDRHFAVVIHTTRGDTGIGASAVFNWLKANGATNALEWRVTNRKVPALVYVDDRGWRFEGPGTFPTVQEIHLARPWNKR